MCKTRKNNTGANAPVDGGNKFQSLIDSPSAQTYTPEERESKTVQISEQQFVSGILPAIQAATREHAASRAESVGKKVEKRA